MYTIRPALTGSARTPLSVFYVSVHQLSSVLRLLYPMTVDRTTVASVIPADIVMLSFFTDHYLS